jgi:hypothetical protein
MDGVPREESAPQRDKLGLADVGSLYDNRVYQPQRKIGARQTDNTPLAPKWCLR